MGKLLRVGGMRRCCSPIYTPPRGICSRGGGRGPHAGQGVVTEQPPHCREGTAGGGGQTPLRDRVRGRWR